MQVQSLLSVVCGETEIAELDLKACLLSLSAHTLLLKINNYTCAVNPTLNLPFWERWNIYIYIYVYENHIAP